MPTERVLIGAPTLLVMTNQIENLLLVRLDEIPAHRNESRRTIVQDLPAGLAKLLVRSQPPRLQPLPIPLLEDGVAHWTNAGSHWFARCLTGVMKPLVKESVVAGGG